MITFFLMGYKGFRTLKHFFANYETTLIDRVVVSKDSNMRNDFYKEIVQLCEDRKIKYLPRDAEYSMNVNSKYAIAISWRWLIKEINSKLVIFHDSLLPKYRGFNPLVSYLINGELAIGATALFANRQFDRGDIISQASTKIEYPIKIYDAFELVSKNYCELIDHIMEQILISKELEAKPQNDNDATYSLWRDSEDYKINWSRSSVEIKRFIDAVGYPYQGAVSMVEGRSIRIMDADVYRDVEIENRDIGKIIFLEDNCPVVVCGSGLLKLSQIQNEDGSDFLINKYRMRFK